MRERERDQYVCKGGLHLLELEKEGEEEEGETSRLIRRMGRKDVWDLTLV